MNENELMPYGVPGMKWGHRKAIQTSGLTNKQIKKYAKKGYAKDNFKANKSVGGKAYDLFTGAHKISADIQYSSSSKKQNKARAEQYLKDKNKPKSTNNNSQKNPKKSVKTGQKKASKIVSKNGNTPLKATAKKAKVGLSVVQSLYDISDTAAQNRQMTSYLNTASQMSPEYRRRFMYD